MKALVSVLICLTCSTVLASDLGSYVGYTIAAKKTIVGFVDEDGERDSSFKGCKYGRKIIFDDQTYLTCGTYSYTYAYRPDAIILVRGGSWLMLVENESYEMRN
jgi:hypothetical protein